MIKKKIISGITAIAVCLCSFAVHIGSSALAVDETAGAKLYGTSDIVYPATAGLTGTIYNGSKEYATVTDENGNPVGGDIAQVSFYLDNTTEAFQNMSLYIHFDNEIFTYLKYNASELSSGAYRGYSVAITTPARVYEKGFSLVSIPGISMDAMVGSGIITTLDFFVPHDTPAGCYPITIEIIDFGYRDSELGEVDLNCSVKHNAFITVAGSAESTEAIDLGESADVLDTYIAENNVDTTLDGVEGCSPFDIYWSNPNQATYQIGEMLTLELGLRGDANLDGVVDARDAATISKYQSTLASSPGADVILNETNDALAKALANVNNDAMLKSSVSICCVDTRDAALVSKCSSLAANYTSGISDAQMYKEIWQTLDAAN